MGWTFSAHFKLVRAQRELIEKNTARNQLARTDALTGLANSRAVEEVLGAEFKRSQRYGIPFAIAMADVDRVKSVNDEHGHPTGDLVLKEIARTMRHSVRETDCGGRFGGEEFLAVLGSNDVEGGRVFAERWRQAVEAIEVPLPSGEMPSTSIGIGVSA